MRYFVPYISLGHLSQFWRVMVRYNFRKELFHRLKGIFSLGKMPFLFPSRITKTSIRNVISVIILNVPTFTAYLTTGARIGHTDDKMTWSAIRISQAPRL